VVDERSATIDGYESNSLAGNHSEMNKYGSTNDCGFGLISSKLLDLVQWSKEHGVPMMSRKKLQLSYDIPFSPFEGRQNANFVGREYLLEQLQETINSGLGGATAIEVVLYGMGGMGKTQVALQYVDRHYQDYSSVFWLNAASEQTLRLGFVHIMQRLIDHHVQFSDEPDYTEIGRLLGITGKVNAVGRCSVQQQEDEQQIVSAVKRWFNDEANTRWLLVFDNFDDLESFDLNDYSPSGRHGTSTIVITSRRRESLQGRRWLEVSQMNDSEAEKLLIQTANFRFENLTPDGK